MKTFKKLSLGEWTTLCLLVPRFREMDPTLGDLCEQVSRGDDTAMVPMVDRLIELGREEHAARIKELLGL